MISCPQSLPIHLISRERVPFSHARRERGCIRRRENGVRDNHYGLRNHAILLYRKAKFHVIGP